MNLRSSTHGGYRGAWQLMTGLSLVLLAGCATPGDGGPAGRVAGGAPVTTTTRLEPAAAQVALQQQLMALGFAVAADQPGVVVGEIARGAPPDWSDCERILIENDDGLVRRTHWAGAETRRVWVELRIGRNDAGTVVTVDPYYAAVYRNRFNNLDFSELCYATGRLEAQLLSAVGGS